MNGAKIIANSESARIGFTVLSPGYCCVEKFERAIPVLKVALEIVMSICKVPCRYF
jgi:hypothetical protein